MVAVARSVADRLIADAAKKMETDPDLREGLVEDLLAAITFPVFELSSKDGKSLETWVHGSSWDVRYGRWDYEAGSIRLAAEEYLRYEPLRSNAMDWLLADALAYAEVNSTWRALRPFDKVPSGMGLAMTALWFLTKWAIWAAIAFIAFLVSVAVGWAWLGLSAWHIGARWYSRNKEAKLLVAMNDAYQSLDSVPPSWTNTWDLLCRSRDMGAKWPTVLYKLVEARKRA